MALRSFLNSLLENGRVHVDRPDVPLEAAAGEANELLVGFDRLVREQLAFDAPEFSLEVARWAAERMYRGCQCLVFRELDEQAVRGALGVACPRSLSAGTIYSADLLFRHLGDLLTMARAIAERDVLVAELLRLAAVWPLSSVGITHLSADQLDPCGIEIILGDRCLRQLYIDRVIARRDRSRLENSGVRDGVREAIGMYEELWPEAGR